MGRRTRSAAVAGAVLCAATVAGLGSAEGHRFNAPTTVEISSGGPTGAAGTVTSPRAVCVPNRAVVLFRVGGGRERIGQATTDAQGHWSVRGSLRAGNYQALVAGKTLPNRLASPARKKKKKKHSHKCQGATSKIVRL